MLGNAITAIPREASHEPAWPTEIAEPVLLTVTPEGLSGTLNSVANEHAHRVFLDAQAADGLVERAAGKVLLGSQTVTTDHPAAPWCSGRHA